MKISLSRALGLLALTSASLSAEVPADWEDDPTFLGATNTWVVELAPDAVPELVAHEVGAIYRGPLRGLPQYHRFVFAVPQASRPEDPDLRAFVQRRMESVPAVRWQEQQVKRLVTTKDLARFEAEPLFDAQWHLQQTGDAGGMPGEDINVRPVWAQGIDGSGVVVGVVDEGTEVDHPDLAPRYLNDRGFDAIDQDLDPRPERNNEAHGTAVAGIILASANGIDGVGIAPEAELAAIRLIGGGVSDAETAEALTFQNQMISIYNNSWGPSDDFGVRFAGAGRLTASAIRNNTRFGRGGLGNIYVWAAGNGGLNNDNANYDSYNASIYTISVAAIGWDGRAASYSEPGANVLVGAPSRGVGQGILTTDLTGDPGYVTDSDTTPNFGGTSAAAPMVAGVVALMLEANPNLTWRDVMHILVRTAVQNDVEDEDWVLNGVGRPVNHKYGYGRVDAAAAVALAQNWPGVAAMETIARSDLAGVFVPQNQTVVRNVTVSNDFIVEQAEVVLSLGHSHWGDLEVTLISPDGTESALLVPHNTARSPVNSWTFNSVRHWGESATGTWQLRVTDVGTQSLSTLDSWSLRLHGTPGSARPPAIVSLPEAPLQSTVFPLDFDPFAGNEALLSDDFPALTLASLSSPAFGETVGNSLRDVRYSMPADFRGSDRVGLFFTDPSGASLRRYFTITNPLPAALNDTVATVQNAPVSVDLLLNDFDPDDDTLRVGGVTRAPRFGEVTLTGSEAIYTPAAGFSGWDRFAYQLTDDDDGEDEAWATVVVSEEADFVLEFDGLDDFVQINARPDFNLRNNFTLEAWIYPTAWGEASTGFGRIFDKDNALLFLNGFRHAFYPDRSLIFFLDQENGETTAALGAESIVLDTWQHVAVSVDVSRTPPVAMYVDGVAIPVTYASEVGGPPTVPVTDNADISAFIGENEAGTRAFEGSIAEVRIWGGVRTQAQIAASANTPVSAAESDLLVAWTFAEGSGSRLGATGFLNAPGSINGPIWRPREVPWQPILDYFPGIEDTGTGWWQDTTLGWLYADDFPWALHLNLGYVYFAGRGGDTTWFYHPAPGLGWLFTNADFYPWLYHGTQQEWLRYDETSAGPWQFEDSQGRTLTFGE